jgi:PAS domain S-box-containing protein
MQRLAAVVRDSNDAIILFDFTGRILAWNHGAKWMYGYDEAEALQLNIDALVPENVRPIQSALLERILSGEPIKSYEIQRITRDGREIDVWLTVSVLRDESGSPMAIATTERDVTEKNQTQRTLRERESRFRQLADANVIGVILSADEQGNIIKAMSALTVEIDFPGPTRHRGRPRASCLDPTVPATDASPGSVRDTWWPRHESVSSRFSTDCHRR